MWTRRNLGLKGPNNRRGFSFGLIVIISCIFEIVRGQYFDPNMDDKTYLDNLQYKIENEVKVTKADLFTQAKIVELMAKQFVAAQLKENLFLALRVLAEKELKELNEQNGREYYETTTEIVSKYTNASTEVGVNSTESTTFEIAVSPRQDDGDDEDGETSVAAVAATTVRAADMAMFQMGLIPQVANLIKAIFGGNQNINLTNYVSSATRLLPKPVGNQVVGLVSAISVPHGASANTNGKAPLVVVLPQGQNNQAGLQGGFGNGGGIRQQGNNIRHPQNPNQFQNQNQQFPNNPNQGFPPNRQRPNQQFPQGASENPAFPPNRQNNPNQQFPQGSNPNLNQAFPPNRQNQNPQAFPPRQNQNQAFPPRQNQNQAFPPNRQNQQGSPPNRRNQNQNLNQIQNQNQYLSGGGGQSFPPNSQTQSSYAIGDTDSFPNSPGSQSFQNEFNNMAQLGGPSSPSIGNRPSGTRNRIRHTTEKYNFIPSESKGISDVGVSIPSGNRGTRRPKPQYGQNYQNNQFQQNGQIGGGGPSGPQYQQTVPQYQQLQQQYQQFQQQQSQAQQQQLYQQYLQQGHQQSTAQRQQQAQAPPKQRPTQQSASLTQAFQQTAVGPGTSTSGQRKPTGDYEDEDYDEDTRKRQVRNGRQFNFAALLPNAIRVVVQPTDAPSPPVTPPPVKPRPTNPPPPKVQPRPRPPPPPPAAAAAPAKPAAQARPRPPPQVAPRPPPQPAVPAAAPAPPPPAGPAAGAVPAAQSTMMPESFNLRTFAMNVGKNINDIIRIMPDLFRGAREGVQLIQTLSSVLGGLDGLGGLGDLAGGIL